MLTDHIRDTASLLESHRGIQIFGTFEHDFISMLKSFLKNFCSMFIIAPNLFEKKTKEILKKEKFAGLFSFF